MILDPTPQQAADGRSLEELEKDIRSCLYGYNGSGPIPDAKGALDALLARQRLLEDVARAAQNAEQWMIANCENELKTFLEIPLSEWLPVVTSLDALARLEAEAPREEKRDG